MINISTQSTLLPVKIGELTFHFDVSDAGLRELAKKHTAAMKKIEKLKDSDEDAAKQVLTETFDLLLGEGAYEQIYKQTPSMVICLNTLIKLSEAIATQVQVINPINPIHTQQEKAQAYLKKKHKKRKK